LEDWEIEARASGLFWWYPLTGLVDLGLRPDEPDTLSTSMFTYTHKKLVALRCDPDKQQVPENCEEVEIPDQVVWEMRGRDSTAPYYTLYRDTDNRSRLESEINEATRKYVQALMA
jgi:hypothetical protein